MQMTIHLEESLRYSPHQVIVIKPHLDIHSNTREKQVSWLHNVHPQFGKSSCTVDTSQGADAEFGSTLTSTLSLPVSLFVSVS